MTKKPRNSLILNCIKLILITLLLIPLTAAGNYGSGIYGADFYGVGELVAPTPAPSSGGGGGGGCSYDWECTDWFPSICPEIGIQERICMNRGDCPGTRGMPEQNQTCEYLGPQEPLFDIFLDIQEDYKEICSGDNIRANINLKNFGKVELLDAFMTYWVVDENNQLIGELKDTRAVEKETNFIIELKIPDGTQIGTYKLYAEITYSGDKTALSGESFEILSEEECKEREEPLNYWIYIIPSLTILAIIIITVIILKRYRRDRQPAPFYQEFKKEDTCTTSVFQQIKLKPILIALGIILALIALLIIAIKVIRFVINSSLIEKTNLGPLIPYILLGGIAGFLIVMFLRKAVRAIRLKKQGKYLKNRLTGLIGKRVYAEDGDYIGQIKEVFLGENKINALKIKVNKRKFKVKAALLKYNAVRGVGDTLIVNKDVRNHL